MRPQWFVAAALAASAALLPAAPAAPAATARASAAAPAAKFDPAVARKISGAELRRRQTRRLKTIVLDTRSTVDSEPIAGAYNVPVDVVEAWARRVPKAAYIVAYCTCDDDGLAIDAVLALQRLGFTNAYVLEGGLEAARQAGVPLGALAG
jgi:rhodanese-related sulfurtransferase